MWMMAGKVLGERDLFRPLHAIKKIANDQYTIEQEKTGWTYSIQ